RHRLGGRGPHRARGAGRLLAGRAHGHGGLDPVRRSRDHREQDIRPPLGMAELDLPAGERGGSQGRARGVRYRPAQRVRPEESVMAGIDYSERIPNNVSLGDNRRLQRALEEWQPKFIDWWMSMGPDGFQQKDVYLRTAVSVDAQGWAQFDYVKMPEYRWGLFLAEAEAGRTIGFGDHLGAPSWQEVPGEYRGVLRRLIVTQGDTEPASVEQQRHLGATCPSLYDLRNLFQINVEEGRHLWAMVYLLDAYFGRDGREESEALLQRRSGDRDKPRILGAFNEKTPDWLSYLMFTYFTDRDGKYQLASLAESGFAPLSPPPRLPAPAASCSPRRRTICSWVRPASGAWCSARARSCARARPTTSGGWAESTSRRCRSTSTSTTRCRSICSGPRSRPTPRTSTRWASRGASRNRRRRTTTGSRTPPTR